MGGAGASLYIKMQVVDCLKGGVAGPQSYKAGESNQSTFWGAACGTPMPSETVSSFLPIKIPSFQLVYSFCFLTFKSVPPSFYVVSEQLGGILFVKY